MGAGERIRLFCALQLPVETRDGLAAWARAHIPESAGRLVRGDDLQGRLERLGVYRREGRRWLAHVTVVRFRARAGLALALPNMCSIHVVRSALYRSTPGPGGARYEALETASLGGT